MQKPSRAEKIFFAFYPEFSVNNDSMARKFPPFLHLPSASKDENYGERVIDDFVLLTLIYSKCLRFLFSGECLVSDWLPVRRL